MENLGYWNLRAVEAKIEDDECSTPQTVENLALARCVVSLIEGKLFNGKDLA